MLVQPLHTTVRGRGRYRVRGLYRSEPLRKYLEVCLSGEKGIGYASGNSLTGSFFVRFNSDNTHSSIAASIERLVREFPGDAPGADPLTSRRADRDPPGDPVPSAPPRAGNSGEKGLPSRRKLRKQIVQAEEQEAGPWHRMEGDQVASLLETSRRSGLSLETVSARLRRFGPNLLPESVPRSGLSILVGQIASLPVALLGVAACVSLATGGLADAVVILGVVAINAAIGYTTESQAERTIHALKRLVRPSALVIREGILQEIQGEEVAVGDLLVLKPGSYIPADGRLIETTRLSVDESTLTGESMPVVKSPEPLPPPPDGERGEVPLADRTNMVYMGTLVTGGQGIAVVVGTGGATEIGKIQRLVGEARSPETPMERQLDQMGRQMVLIGLAVCGGVFVIGLLRGYGMLQMFKTSIFLAVAAVPEGLPTVATTTLALGLRHMRKYHVLIRRLDAVETLGSVQTLCLDKTGTITRNRMSVAVLHAGGNRFHLKEGAFLGERGLVRPEDAAELLRLIQVSVLCNETEIGRQEGEYVLRGSSTEAALVSMALDSGMDVERLRKERPLRKLNHRSENWNMMSTLHDLPEEAREGGDRLIALKGSPLEVLSLCRRHMKDGEILPLSEEYRLHIEIENERMAGEALRVLGTAYGIVPEGGPEGRGQDDLIWLGLVGMADPVRDGVRELMERFHRAGIDTVMITGDQSPTAYAIGKSLNLSRGESLEILDSTQIGRIDPEVLQALASKVHVFARVSPAHKLQIVQALQKAGKVVAMTGDGVNDGPALKAADIGIAMGHTGTDVARDVADVVLENDQLETMILAVRQGRTIYGNIRKSVRFLLTTNLSEILVMFTAIAGGLGQPLNAMQLLWINLVSDIFPGLALALEPAEPDVLDRPPRNPGDPIVRDSDFRRIGAESAVLSAGALGAYGYGLMRYGPGAAAGTLAFMSLTAGQLLHAFSCRSEEHRILGPSDRPSNRYLQGAVAGSLALQGTALFIPGLRSLLGIAPISLLDGLVIGGGAVLPLLVNEITQKPGGSS